MQLGHFVVEKQNLGCSITVSEYRLKKQDLLSSISSHQRSISRSKLPLIIGHDSMGKLILEDLYALPHLLMGGATSSGKTNALRVLIMGLLMTKSIDKINLIIIDTVTSDLKTFKEIPHLSCPIIDNTLEAIIAIKSLEKKLEQREKLPNGFQKIPAIVCIIDELESFIASIPNKSDLHATTTSLSNLLRRGRHANIHLIISSQNPTKCNTQIELSNITARIAFKCAKFQESISILGSKGAEKLHGNGELYLVSYSYPDKVFAQSILITDDEIRKIIEYSKKMFYGQRPKFRINLDIEMRNIDQSNIEIVTQPVKDADSHEFVEIIKWVLQHESISALQLIKKFRMSNRAYAIMDKMCELGLIAKKFAKLPRSVLPQCTEDVPVSIMALLEKNGVTKDEVNSIFLMRSK
jgi:S-DNA-T family DNA segregation ATPase FtsK/SpoIIIE